MPRTSNANKENVQSKSVDTENKVVSTDTENKVVSTENEVNKEETSILNTVEKKEFTLKNESKAGKKLSGPKGVISFDENGIAKVDFETAKYFKTANGYTVEE